MKCFLLLVMQHMITEVGYIAVLAWQLNLLIYKPRVQLWMLAMPRSIRQPSHMTLLVKAEELGVPGRIVLDTQDVDE